MPKYKSTKQASRPQDLRGAPFWMDSILYWLLKSLIQIPLLWISYMLTVNWIRSYAINSIHLFFLELAWIMTLLFITDMIAKHLFADPLDDYIIHQWGYLRNPRRSKTKLLMLTQYILYLLYRAFAYIFGLIWLLTAMFYPSCGGFAFLLAWIITSGGAKLLSMLTSSLFFTRF